LARLFGEPSAMACWALLLIAAVAAVAVLLDRRPALAMWVAYLAGLLLVSASYSHAVMWSHGEVVTFLAGMPLLFLGRSDLPIRGAQVMLGLFFANAVWWKLDRTGTGWGTSENMRNILGLRYGVIGDEATPVAGFALDHAWFAGLLAKGNLVNQFVPLAMVPLLRWRSARLVAAGAWALEVVGLMVVMGLYPWAMLPLGLLFLLPVEDREPARWVVPVLATIVAVQVVVAWVGRDPELRAYPFTASIMYSEAPQRVQWLELDGQIPDTLRRTYGGYPGDRCAVWDQMRRLAADAGGIDRIDVAVGDWTISHGKARRVDVTPLGTWRPGAEC
jgi:hypothetical protein